MAGELPLRMPRLALTFLALAACATDPVEPELDLTSPDTTEPSGTLQPGFKEVVRELSLSCATRIDGIEELRVTVTSDRGVAFAFAQLRNGDVRETLDLSFTIDYGPNGIIVGGRPEHVNEAQSTGKLELGPDSAFTCATLPEFGVHVTVAFENGAVGCVTGGNAAQAKSFVCQ
jgi:hypothetical protein